VREGGVGTAELARALNQLERYNDIAKPFAWNLTHLDLARLPASTIRRTKSAHPSPWPRDRHQSCGGQH
jgi:hypothetical protein